MLSIIYEVQDMWYNDSCTSDKGHWTDTSGLSFNSDGMQINCDADLNINYPTDFSAEFTITEPTRNPTRWTSAVHCRGTGFVGNGTTSYWYDDNNGTYTTTNNKPIKSGTVKFIVENGTCSVYYNNTLMKTANEKVSDKLHVLKPPYNTDHLRIKDLKIKAL